MTFDDLVGDGARPTALCPRLHIHIVRARNIGVIAQCPTPIRSAIRTVLTRVVDAVLLTGTDQ